MNSDIKPSLVRTLVPFLVGPLVTALAGRLGLDLDDVAQGDMLLLLTGAVSGVFGYLYYVGARFAEVYVSPKWGYILGMAKAPEYVAKPRRRRA